MLRAVSPSALVRTERNTLNKRILVFLALSALAALTVSACGGGSSDEDKITETIEKFATSEDPGKCTELETRRFVEQTSTEMGKPAVRTCEKNVESGAEESEGVKVSNISVDGGSATADVAFEGGALNSQTLEVALVEEGGWKLDYVEGFAKYDGTALAEGFEEVFEEEESELTPEQSKCIGGKIAALSKAEAEKVVFGGSAEPIIELAQSCG
jgi:hypothetical protein